MWIKLCSGNHYKCNSSFFMTFHCKLRNRIYVLKKVGKILLEVWIVVFVIIIITLRPSPRTVSYRVFWYQLWIWWICGQVWMSSGLWILFVPTTIAREVERTVVLSSSAIKRKEKGYVVYKFLKSWIGEKKGL